MTTKLDGYDIFSPQFRNCPHPHWQAMREGCPVAHSDNTGGSWMLAAYDDIRDAVRDPERFSSRSAEVAGPAEYAGGLLLPPITSDPPEHRGHRERLAPFFHPRRIAELEPFVRELARSLAGEFAARGGGDAAAEFAQRLTVSVLAKLLDVPPETHARFIDWTVRLLRLGPLSQEIRACAVREMIAFFDALLTERATGDGDDLLSHLARAETDRKVRIGSAMVVMIAGADTTWSAISASLFHLGTHPEDRRRLAREPDLMSTAVEELLRAYAPVMLARLTTGPVEVRGTPIPAGERVILPLASANRDPGVFDEPDTVLLDRRRNRHLAFGSGAHRCLGSTLARLELRVALEEWLRVIPDYDVIGPDAVEWTGGNVRGPDTVPVRVRT
ncbi:cytochrome P450 [Nonomuraea purpurea]|uniref:Cytochrome P450 n=1 Tax=Nonomuraea purpurea TaxID=1849276 RepID=A0ABV8G2S3_9ACTN